VTIPQELRLVPSLSIAENFTLGDPPVKRVFGLRIVDRRRMKATARQACRLLFALYALDRRKPQERKRNCYVSSRQDLADFERE
jgi:ABC-type sugar transport system ATPase subunit